MEVKPGYKRTEIGVIPENWEVRRGFEITDLIGKGASPRWQGFDYADHGMLFVTSENVRDGYLDISNPKFLPLAFHEKLRRTQLGQNDILVNLVGASIGRSCRITQDIGAANVNQAVAVFRLRDLRSAPFMEYFFQAPTTIKRILDMQADAARPNISLGNLRQFSIPFPPLPEQHAIAEALGDVDALLDALTRLIAKKRDLKQAAMQQLFTGQTRLPGFGGEWEVVRFMDVADKMIPWSIVGGPFGSNLKTSDYTAEGVRIIQLQNIGDGRFDDEYAIYTSEAKADELLSSNIYPGEIILSKMGDPVARACFVPSEGRRYLMASDGIRLAVDARRFDKLFVHDFINSPYFTQQAIAASTGSTRRRIGLDELKRLPFLAPPLTEQTEIAAVLSDMAADLTAVEARLAKTRALKQGMMQELLTGRTRLV